MDEALKVRLLQEIAASFPYTYDEVKYVYDTVKSIDATIKVCEIAVKGNFACPITIINLLERDDRLGSIPHGIDLLNRWPIKPGPSETKSDLPDTLLGYPIKYTSDLKLGGFEIKFGPFEFYGPEDDAANKT